MIKAGSKAGGDEGIMRAYLEVILEYNQGRVQLPPEASEGLPAMHGL